MSQRGALLSPETARRTENRIAVLEEQLGQMAREITLLRMINPWTAPQQAGGGHGAARTLDIAGGSAFHGTNWYPLDRGDASGRRWSGPGRLSSIFVAVDRSVLLEGRLEGTEFAPGVQPSLTIFVDGVERLTARVEGGTDPVFLLPPVRRPGAPTEICFMTAATWQPKGDNRWLGFRFARLSIRPLG